MEKVKRRTGIKESLIRLGALTCLILALGGETAGSADASAKPPAAKVGEAPAAACGNPAINAPKRSQENTMLCLINRARAAFNIPPLAEAEDLDTSATLKTHDEVRYGFAHDSDGKPWSYYFPPEYQVRGEDLAWGVGSCATVLAIYGGLMHSATHRTIILSPYEQYIGMDMQRDDGTTYWTLHFGGLQPEVLPPPPAEVIEPTRCLTASP